MSEVDAPSSRGGAVLGRARALLRAGRPKPQPAAGRTVTVVIPFCDTEAEFFDDAVDSVVGQRHGDLDIIVVLHGRCAVAAGLAAQRAESEPRMRVLELPGRERPVALNAGAEAARGEYLMFVRASDDLPTRAVSSLLASLRSSSSDFAVGAVERTASSPDVAAQARAVPQRPAQRVRVADVPRMIAETDLGNRLFVTRFWNEDRLRFPEPGSGARRDPVVQAYLRASAFDVLDVLVYRDLNRGRGTPLGHRPDAMAGLEEWLEHQEEALVLLAGAPVPVRTAWLADVLENNLTALCEDVERSTLEQWTSFRDHVRRLTDLGGSPLEAALSAEASVRSWLVCQDRRAELERFMTRRMHTNGHRPTEVRNGKVVALLPYYRDPHPGVPDDHFEMSVQETPLGAILWGARWDGGHTLELSMFTFVNFVDCDGQRPEVSIRLVDQREQAPLTLAVTPFDDVFANATIGHRYQDYTPCGVRVAVPTTMLASEGQRYRQEHGDDPVWRLAITVTLRGVRRTGTLSAVDPRGTAGGLETAFLAPVTVGPQRIAVQTDPNAGIRVIVSPAPEVSLLSATTQGRTISGSLASAGGQVTAVVARRATDDRQVDARVVDGTFDLELPDVGYVEARTDLRRWKLRAVVGDVEQPIGWPEGSTARWLAASPTSQVTVSKSPRGTCDVGETSRTLVLEDVRLGEQQVTVTGRWLGPEPPSWRVALQGAGQELAGSVLPAESPGEVTAVFPTTSDPWRLHNGPVPPGAYRVVVLTGAAAPSERVESVPLVSDGLWARLLTEQLSSTHRLRLVKLGRELRLTFEAPVPQEQRGAYAQTRLRQAYGSNQSVPTDPDVVYLQSYLGASATDSPLAIALHLRETRPDLRLFWGVADRSAWVPDGVVPVMMRTAEWHRTRARAGYLVSNVDLDRSFRKRPGQRLLQTFHGYPSKTMGIRMWKAKGFTPSMIELELQRTSRDWDLILTPEPEMDRYYRQEYRYDGAILSHGYPRDDVLVSAQADEVRAATRARLGIEPTQKAVLYAPTWRDHLASDHRSAPTVRHLDVESASSALGEDYVFLMRGHRYSLASARRGRRHHAARLLDVTTYPEVNDLILAADVAVLDYSSMRFDFALTSRPMLFLVPDLDVYTGAARGFLYDYRDTTPGPLLFTAEEVVERLRDVPGLEAEYAQARADFNARYNHLQDGTSTARVVREFFGPAPS